MSDTMFGVGELSLSLENRAKGSKKDGKALISQSIFREKLAYSFREGS